MSHLSLPLKYRPKRLSDIVGQDSTVTALTNAIEKDRVRQAYIFSGIKGSGKTSTARVLAKSLNCLKAKTPVAKPCQMCRSCKAVQTGDDISVIEIDGATHNKVDDIRKINKEVGTYGMHGRFKIYIIDEVQMLTKPAFNALLKTLEEPPSHVKFLLCTTDLGSIPATVQSRCQVYRFYPVKEKDIVEQLNCVLAAEGQKAEADVAQELAEMVNGSLRDALTLLDQVINVAGDILTAGAIRSFYGKPKRSHVAEVLAALSTGNAGKTSAAMKKLTRRGFSEYYIVTTIIQSLQERIQARLMEPDKLEVIVDIILELEALSRVVRSSDVPGPLFEASLLKIALNRRDRG